MGMFGYLSLGKFVDGKAVSNPLKLFLGGGCGLVGTPRKWGRWLKSSEANFIRVSSVTGNFCRWESRFQSSQAIFSRGDLLLLAITIGFEKDHGMINS